MRPKSPPSPQRPARHPRTSPQVSIKKVPKWPSSKRKIVSFSNRSLRNLFAVSAAASAKTPRLRKFLLEERRAGAKNLSASDMKRPNHEAPRTMKRIVLDASALHDLFG